MALTYSIDTLRRRVMVVGTAQPTTDEVFAFLTRIFEAPAFEAGFDVLWNRANMTSAPTRQYVEQVVQWLRDRPQFGRVAMLVNASKPADYGMGRMLEFLRERDVEGRLQVFKDFQAAERWLDGSSTARAD